MKRTLLKLSLWLRGVRRLSPVAIERDNRLFYGRFRCVSDSSTLVAHYSRYGDGEQHSWAADHVRPITEDQYIKHLEWEAQ